MEHLSYMQCRIFSIQNRIQQFVLPKQMDPHTIINLFHIFLVVPFFLYLGIQKDAAPKAVFWVALGLGIIVTLYHAYKSYIRYTSGSAMIWINLIHALFVGPLLIFIGSQQEKTPRSAYELLLLLAFAAGGYHLYELAVYNTMLN